MKKRIDSLLVERGYFESREKAKANIMAGNIFVNDSLVDKPGMTVSEDVVIRLKNVVNPYVSRGGFKLEKAIREFSIDLKGKLCMDIGASTGGFTDCMLQNGASKIYAVDVGYGQLDWKLRNDDRVVCMERTNIRYLDTSLIEETIDFISVDVSFISLKLVIPIIEHLIHQNSEIVMLIKPQFEAGREEVSKHSGIIKDPLVHERVIKDVLSFCAMTKLSPQQLSFSPIKGPKGNIEFLLYATVDETTKDFENEVSDIVKKAHEEFV